MSERFFLQVPMIDHQGKLIDEQAHHAIHVMRLRAGDPIILFDGSGKEFRACVTKISKKELAFLVVESVSSMPPMRPSITIATALPKGDRQKFLIEKLVELGCDRMIPLKTQRSVAVAPTTAIERFKKSVIEACKQCGRNHLMEILPELTIDDLIRESDSWDMQKFLANPSTVDWLNATIVSQDRQVLIAIGPEGGFDTSELNQFAQAEWRNVRLARHTLRTETAALLAVGLLVNQLEQRSIEQSRSQ
jgi:16S rRNA (uracil1498-N3)-methyltransferase